MSQWEIIGLEPDFSVAPPATPPPVSARQAEDQSLPAMRTRAAPLPRLGAAASARPRAPLGSGRPLPRVPPSVGQMVRNIPARLRREQELAQASVSRTIPAAPRRVDLSATSGATRRTAPPMTLDERAGLDPNADRLNVLPYPRGALKGGEIDWTDWVSPRWFASLKRSFVLPEHVRQGGAATAEDALEFALGIAGAGALSKVGRPGRRLPRKRPAGTAPTAKQLRPVAPDVERVIAARTGPEITAGLPEFIRRSKATGDRKIEYGLGGVKNAPRIKAATGHDVEGYTRIVDNYGIRHTFKQHGDAKSEALRGQLPVTEGDIARIPEVLSAPDRIIALGKNDSGHDVIGYQKRINGVVLYVEEVRTGRKQLALNTMWKRAAKNGR